MRKRSERSLVFFAVVFVFACLLLSGGSRLIGHEGERPAPAVRVSFADAAFSAAPAPMGETGHDPARSPAAQRLTRLQRPDGPSRPVRVLSDANGNILRGSSYMKTVHQAFTLGDGFV